MNPPKRERLRMPRKIKNFIIQFKILIITTHRLMIDLFKNYFEKRIQLIKLELIGVFANVASGLVTSLLLLILSLFILFMFSFSLAYWIGQLLNNIALGFAFVGAFYTLLFIVYIFISKNKVEQKIKDQIVKAALSSEEKEINTID